MPLRAMLVLYVLDNSRKCEDAWTSVLRALRRFDPLTIEVSLRNLSRVVERTALDRRVLVVPTLMMIEPSEDHLIGGFQIDDVVDFLRRAGVRPRREFDDS